MISGRDLEAGDQHAVLVNATLAGQLDASGTAVGREIRLDGSVRQIVGVFQDAKWETVYEPPRPRSIALTAARSGGAAFAIEVDGNPGAYVAALRRELLAAQPGSLVASAETLRQHYQNSLILERRATQVFYGLGLLALLLTSRDCMASRARYLRDGRKSSPFGWHSARPPARSWGRCSGVA
jgi:hypothetical protein